MDYITTEQAAHEKGCSRQAIIKAIQRGAINAERLGGRSLVIRDEKYAAYQKVGHKGKLKG